MIGTAAALIGSAVVGAGASALSASKNSKAINKATDAQTQANDRAVAAQQQARQENLALQQPIYNAGLPAMQARNALLGLGGTAPQVGQQGLPTAQPNALAQYQGFNPDTTGGRFGVADAMASNDLFYNPRQMMGTGLGNEAGYPGGPMFGGQQGAMPTAQPQQGQQPGQTAQQAAENAFDIFRNSTGYKFRLGEGIRAINGGYAGSGTLQSGAALKSINDYGQNMASAEFGNYFGALGEQQNLASGAANAMSGVNTTFANNASNLAIANGQTAANAAVAKANNSNALISSIGGSLGSILGGFGR